MKNIVWSCYKEKLLQQNTANSVQMRKEKYLRIELSDGILWSWLKFYVSHFATWPSWDKEWGVSWGSKRKSNLIRISRNLVKFQFAFEFEHKYMFEWWKSRVRVQRKRIEKKKTRKTEATNSKIILAKSECTFPE